MQIITRLLGNQVQFLDTKESSLIVSKAPLVALLTNQGSSSTPTWSVPNGAFSANAEVWDVLTCTKYTADGNGALSVTGSSGKPQVCLVSSQPLHRTLLNQNF